MDVNEVAQWIVLAFLAFFVLGLTRQLGIFIRPHAEELAEMGPDIGGRLPPALIDEATRRRLSALTRAKSARRRAAVFVVDEQCAGCRAVIEDLHDDGRPDGVILAAIVKDAASERFRASVRSLVDVVIDDPTGDRCDAAGIYGTPLVMLVDEHQRVVAKDFGGDIAATVRHWSSVADQELPERIPA